MSRDANSATLQGKAIALSKDLATLEDAMSSARLVKETSPSNDLVILEDSAPDFVFHLLVSLSKRYLWLEPDMIPVIGVDKLIASRTLGSSAVARA